jgi:DNA-binding response OmpR family regulator
MNIFLVEDDPIYAEFIRKALGQNKEFTVRWFTSAEECMEACKGGLPQFFIVDYKLPGMSGIELYDQLKPRFKENNRLIMLSALDDGNMVLSFIKRGVRDYVIKDENVIESLTAILQGKEDDYFLFD